MQIQQIKKETEVGIRISGATTCLWGGREGGDSKTKGYKTNLPVPWVEEASEEASGESVCTHTPTPSDFAASAALQLRRLATPILCASGVL